MNDYKTNVSLEISLPKGLIAPDNGIPAQNIKLYLPVSELEQIKSALKDGERVIQTRLNNIKRDHYRCKAQIDENTVISVLNKVKRAKPEQVYSLEILEVELEAVIYCLKHSKNSKSKRIRATIDFLSSYFDCEG